MREKKRSLSLGSVLTIALTVCVIIGCVLFFSAFRSGENVVMTAQKMAGLIGGAVKQETEMPAQVRTVTVTLAPSVQTATPAPDAGGLP